MQKLSHNNNIIVIYTFIVVSLLLFYKITNTLDATTPSVKNRMPDSAVRTINLGDICTTKLGTAGDIPLKTKKLVYKNANVPYSDKEMCSIGFEIDHIVSFPNGGSNNISNLQLQSYCDFADLTKLPNTNTPIYKGLYNARKKDAFEDVMHTDICKGDILLKDAQDIQWNWKN